MGQLVGGEERHRTIAGLLEHRQRQLAGGLTLLELAHAPDKQPRQAELDGGAPGRIGRLDEHQVDRPERVDGHPWFEAATDEVRVVVVMDLVTVSDRPATRKPTRATTSALRHVPRR